MDAAELDHEIDELEQRVERLRSLYEQYFMGIEKLEPLTPRKDVDRRIWVLRREQIRNTRKRFRLQTIVQRYNTYQQYWMRITREIEAGTYRRHLIKAQKILENFNPLTTQARKRHRMLVAAAQEEDARLESQRPQADGRPASDLPDLDFPEGPAPDDDEAFARLDDLFGGGTAAGAPPARAASRAPARRPRPAVRGPIGDIDLELDAVGGVLQASFAPARARDDESEPPTPRRSAPATGKSAAEEPPLVVAAPGVAARPVAPPLPVAPLPVAPPLVPAPPVPPTPVRIVPTGPGAVSIRAPLGPPPRGLPPVALAGAAPQPRVGSLQPPPKPRRPLPAPQTAGQPGPLPPSGPTGTDPSRSPPRVAAAPFRAPASGSELSEDRIRAIHARLVEAKQQTAEAAAVSLEGLRKSLTATQAKLRQQHGSHRSVDFEVVIRDGKAVLKPVVR